MTRIEQLKKFLEATPNDSFLKHALGLEYLKVNNILKAQEYFESVINNEPSYIGTYYHLAKLYELLPNREAAIKTYEKGFLEAKEQKNQHAYNELKMAYDELNDD